MEPRLVQYRLRVGHHGRQRGIRQSNVVTREPRGCGGAPEHRGRLHRRSRLQQHVTRPPAVVVVHEQVRGGRRPAAAQ